MNNAFDFCIRFLHAQLSAMLVDHASGHGHTGDIGTVFRRYPEPWKVFIEDADLPVRMRLPAVWYIVTSNPAQRIAFSTSGLTLQSPNLVAVCSRINSGMLPPVVSAGPVQAGCGARLPAGGRGAGHHHPGRILAAVLIPVSTKVSQLHSYFGQMHMHMLCCIWAWLRVGSKNS